MKLSPDKHTESGEEIMDPRPMQPPLGYHRPPTLAEQIRQQVLLQKLDALDALEETEEDADDFAVDDEFEPFSPHENEGMPTIRELKARAKEINDEIKRRDLVRLREQVTSDIEKKQKDAEEARERIPRRKESPEPSPEV